jgi:drug/metabolite transporter (DMT)-like permease
MKNRRMTKPSALPEASLRPYLVLTVAQIAVGSAAIFARFALTGAGPLAVSASRLTIAAVALLALAAIRSPRERTDLSRRDRVLFAIAGLALAIHFAAWIWSLQYTSVAISTLLVATTPIWTAAYDTRARGLRLSALAFFSFAVAAAGLVMVVGYSIAPPPVPGHAALGAALAVAGAIGIAAYFILIREVRASFGTRAIVTQTYTWAAIVLIAAAIAAHQPPPPLSDTAAWGGILAMALISQLLGHTAMNSALRWFSASAVAFTTLVEPIIAALLALAIFGERLSAIAVAGGLLVLGAIAIFIREERRGEARYEVKAAL